MPEYSIARKLLESCKKFDKNKKYNKKVLIINKINNLR